MQRGKRPPKTRPVLLRRWYGRSEENVEVDGLSAMTSDEDSDPDETAQPGQDYIPIPSMQADHRTDRDRNVAEANHRDQDLVGPLPEGKMVVSSHDRGSGLHRPPLPVHDEHQAEVKEIKDRTKQLASTWVACGTSEASDIDWMQ